MVAVCRTIISQGYNYYPQAMLAVCRTIISQGYNYYYIWNYSVGKGVFKLQLCFFLPDRAGGPPKWNCYQAPTPITRPPQPALTVNIPKTLQYSLMGIHITRGGGCESWQNLTYAAVYIYIEQNT